ncbi:Hypothetical protein PP7435_CHR4-0089 [Komagataella phaffii CBS 7435]|nr:GQ67_05255T0 [Komagataella phaffii]AOA69706.1 GQ68_05237T0 [Komagataella phaffii GS115]CAH2450459.1 Hypothetical protein BQ9382_C4-0495 [Komagataella phaffii CBS 7435]SCV12333.1 Hypothetical protein PP7435_CHR4-0089 [Komagataella phaffii CBS 7435]
MLSLPDDIITFMLNVKLLDRKDLVSISMLNKDYRKRFEPILFDKIKMTWSQLNSTSNCSDSKQRQPLQISLHRCFESFMYKDLVSFIRVHSDMHNFKQTSYGEWNTDLSPLNDCKFLKGLAIEVLTSSRCLKYQSALERSQIVSLRICSHSTTDDNASLFQLTHISTHFPNVSKLTLEGFLIDKDQYFMPSLNNSGRLSKLRDITLVNCQWEYPLSLFDIFCPFYHHSSLYTTSKTPEIIQPTSLCLKYTNSYSSFVLRERFKTFINTTADKVGSFKSYPAFYSNLKHLEISILNEEYHTHTSEYYYPNLSWLDLTARFAEDSSSSLINSLRSLKLVGWRVNNLELINQLFGSAFKPGTLERFNLFRVDDTDYPGNQEIYALIDSLVNKPFSNHCKISVRYVNELM